MTQPFIFCRRGCGGENSYSHLRKEGEGGRHFITGGGGGTVVGCSDRVDFSVGCSVGSEGGGGRTQQPSSPVGERREGTF